MGDRGEIASWTSGITHVVLKQVHDQVGYDAFGVMTHTFLCWRPGYHSWSSQESCENADVALMLMWPFWSSVQCKAIDDLHFHHCVSTVSSGTRSLRLRPIAVHDRHTKTRYSQTTQTTCWGRTWGQPAGQR